jgi:hypothetical protein
VEEPAAKGSAGQPQRLLFHLFNSSDKDEWSVATEVAGCAAAGLKRILKVDFPISLLTTTKRLIPFATTT